MAELSHVDEATGAIRMVDVGSKLAHGHRPHIPGAVLLDLDREYREKAEHDRLPRITPRRFNPDGEAWLPVLNTERVGQHYSLLFSNTARAHEVGTTRDWVVIYRDDRDGGGQWTVVTANQGPSKGKRVIRGRERECEAYYSGNASR